MKLCRVREADGIVYSPARQRWMDTPIGKASAVGTAAFNRQDVRIVTDFGSRVGIT
jgi:hypothetical protein